MDRVKTPTQVERLATAPLRTKAWIVAWIRNAKKLMDLYRYTDLVKMKACVWKTRPLLPTVVRVVIRSLESIANSVSNPHLSQCFLFEEAIYQSKLEVHETK